ncbi:MAG: guanylate kinase [Acidobacteria bacterium]|nr:guanylate kinase [Acidobacteriota bacterium]MCI0621999.1 guanylate kinase [Acidobacteriota bacterium]MCI0723383.1 guanylate kinase [Acidobacteriota bacterium]
MSERGAVFIVSAPSGSGKSTLVTSLLQKVPNLTFSISYTTRQPRGEEVDGKEYFFVNEAAFEKMIAEDQFIEYAKVFDHYYGTARAYLERALAEGKDLILDIDTEGAAQVKNKLPEAISIFIMPPSYEALRKRLENRRQDSSETIQKRLTWAGQKEIYRYRNYDYVVVNEDLKQSFDLMRGIILAERCRRDRMTARVQSIIQTFGGK